MPKKPIKVDYSPSDFLGGTILLGPLEELAYRRICDLIYVMDGDLPDDKALADLTKTKRKWPAIRQRLLDLGKIQCKNGRIFNARCAQELSKKREQIEKAQRGAEITNSRKRQKTHDAVADAPRSAGRSAERSLGGAPTGSQPLTLNRESIANTESGSSAREPSEIARVADECFRLARIDPEEQRDFGAGDRMTIASWFNAGAIPERHIFPTIKRIMENRAEPPSTLRYFTKAVHEAIENVPAQANGAAEPPLSKWPPGWQPPTDWSDQDVEWWDIMFMTWVETQNWDKHRYGPAPGQPKCRVPPHVVERYFTIINSRTP